MHLICAQPDSFEKKITPFFTLIIIIYLGFLDGGESERGLHKIRIESWKYRPSERGLRTFFNIHGDRNPGDRCKQLDTWKLEQVGECVVICFRSPSQQSVGLWCCVGCCCCATLCGVAAHWFNDVRHLRNETVDIIHKLQCKTDLKWWNYK